MIMTTATSGSISHLKEWALARLEEALAAGEMEQARYYMRAAEHLASKQAA